MRALEAQQTSLSGFATERRQCCDSLRPLQREIILEAPQTFYENRKLQKRKNAALRPVTSFDTRPSPVVRNFKELHLVEQTYE